MPVTRSGVRAAGAGAPLVPFECEGCGYELTGLDLDGPCPECALPVRQSLTGRRRGSPWQRSPGLESWFETAVSLGRSPRRFWKDVRVEGWESWNLLAINLVAASTATLALAIIRRDPGAGLGLWVVQYIVLFLVSMLIGGVIRLGRRARPAVAQAALGHASVAWVAGATATLFIGSVLARPWPAAFVCIPLSGAAVLIYTWMGVGSLRHVAPDVANDRATDLL